MIILANLVLFFVIQTNHEAPDQLGSISIDSAETDKDIAPEKHQSNWIQDVVEKDAVMFCGDSAGQITLVEKDQITATRKVVHNCS